MKKPYRFVHAGVIVFKVLAWVSLALQVMAGLILLVVGGEPVPVGVGVEIPARLIGVLHFVAAAVYSYLFMLMSQLLKLFLEIGGKVPADTAGSPT